MQKTAGFCVSSIQWKGNDLVKLINKNGIEVHNSAKHVLEEITRGTGSVMAEKMSIFIENASINEKYIVVSKVPDSTGEGKNQKFPVSNFKDAWELFIKSQQDK
jgi:hypothetical protein